MTYTLPRQQKQSWKAFIKKSLERPKLGHWSDMCLAPVDTYVLLFCEANKPYTFYEGQGIGICRKCDSNPDQYIWFLVGKTDQTGIFSYTKCNPHWWMPLPMSPPERPS
jgi:hypothetical protein